MAERQAADEEDAWVLAGWERGSTVHCEKEGRFGRDVAGEKSDAGYGKMPCDADDWTSEGSLTGDVTFADGV